MFNYTDGGALHRKSLKDLDTLAKAASSLKLSRILLERNPHPGKVFALQIVFRRNGEIILDRWADGRYLFIIIQGLKEGKLDWVWDTSGVKLAPRRLRIVRVLKKPREVSHYATWVQLKGAGDTVKFVVWVDGVALRTKRYWRTKRGH